MASAPAVTIDGIADCSTPTERKGSGALTAASTIQASNGHSSIFSDRPKASGASSSFGGTSRNASPTANSASGTSSEAMRSSSVMSQAGSGSGRKPSTSAMKAGKRRNFSATSPTLGRASPP